MALNINNVNLGYATTVTATGTTTLTKDSAYQQFFTGSAIQTVKVPVATTLKLGQRFQIVNLSSNVVTVQTSGSNTIVAMATNTVLYVTCSNTAGGTGTASWTWEYDAINSTSISSGGAAATIPDWEPFPLGNNTSYSSYGQNTLQFFQLYPQANVAMSAMEMLLSISSVSSSISHSANLIFSYALYSQGTGTQTASIFSMGSSSVGMTASYSSNLSGGYTIAQGTLSQTVSSNGTVFASVLTGQKIMSYPMAATLSAGGAYYMGFAQSTASVGGTGALRVSHLAMTMLTNGSFGPMSPNSIGISAASIIHEPFGFIYSATSNAFPSSIGYSQMSIQSGNNPYVFMES